MEEIVRYSSSLSSTDAIKMASAGEERKIRKKKNLFSPAPVRIIVHVPSPSFSVPRRCCRERVLIC